MSLSTASSRAAQATLLFKRWAASGRSVTAVYRVSHVRSSVEGTGRVHLWAAAATVAASLAVQLSRCDSACDSPGIHPRVEKPRTLHSLYFQFGGNCRTISIAAAPSYVPKSSFVSSHPHQVRTCLPWYLVVFIGISLMMNHDWHFFRCFLDNIA